MPDMSMISGIAASLRLAGDITKAMIGVRDEALLQGKIVELQSVILSAQSSAISAQTEQFGLLERIRELETQVARLEGWEAEKQKYELSEPRPGTFAYILKAEAGSGPRHMLCSNCFQHGIKSILQQETRFPGRTDTLACHECGSDIYVFGAPHPDHFKGRPARRSR